MSLSPEQRALCAYLARAGILPKSAFACPPDSSQSEAGARERLVVALGSGASAAPRLYSGVDDAHDWHRNYGMDLLLRGDAIFYEPSYLLALLGTAGPDDQGWRVEAHESPPPALDAWRAAWHDLAPQASVLGFTLTGSEAVNACFDLARYCGRVRLYVQGMAKADVLALTPGMAFFPGSYGGGRGESAGMNLLFGSHTAPVLRDWLVVAPTVLNEAMLTEEARARLTASENTTLERLESMALDTQKALGAIYIEVIQGARGVFFYRRQFLAKLRLLADRHGVPIIDDEVLTVGRTGRFFAYEHYAPEFTPDFVAFGKGLDVAGVAIIDRGPANLRCIHNMHRGLGFVTARCPPSHQLLRSRQILRAIHERGLLAHAERLGQVLLAGLIALEEEVGFTPTASGQGCVLGVAPMLSQCALEGIVAQYTAGDRPRLLPPINLDLDVARAVLDAARQQLLQRGGPRVAATVPINDVSELGEPLAGAMGDSANPDDLPW